MENTYPVFFPPGRNIQETDEHTPQVLQKILLPLARFKDHIRLTL